MGMWQKRNDNAIYIKIGVEMLRQGGFCKRELALFMVQGAEQILSCWRMNEQGIRTRNSNEAESESLGRLPQFTTPVIHSRPHATTRAIQQMPRTLGTMPNRMDSVGVVRHICQLIHEEKDGEECTNQSRTKIAGLSILIRPSLAFLHSF